jgi:transcriptional regulator with XRE-family HTH domain
MTTTPTGAFRAPVEAGEVVTLLLPTVWSGAWAGTSDHVGVGAGCVLVVNSMLTSWSRPFETPSSTAAEEVARLRDRVIEAAGLSRQDIARGIGVDRRSLSGFVTGEIRPSELRLRALQVLADSAEWAAARYGVRAKEILREDTAEGAPLDLIASGRMSVIDSMESAAEALGLVRHGAVTVRTRASNRVPLYLKARETWSNRLDKPIAGGEVRDPAVYEQELSNAARSRAGNPRPRRKQI